MRRRALVKRGMERQRRHERQHAVAMHAMLGVKTVVVVCKKNDVAVAAEVCPGCPHRIALFDRRGCRVGTPGGHAGRCAIRVCGPMRGGLNVLQMRLQLVRRWGGFAGSQNMACTLTVECRKETPTSNNRRRCRPSGAEK